MKTIFVSSTFKDMHFERDAIQEITLPALKSEAIKYGENVSFCDLRWGINTGDLDSEEGSRKVLDVCLDEIDRCKPPMVVILGDRYGWIPSEDLTKSAAERKKIELEDLQISVTALEIAYGALSTPERCRQALFYFRHIESDCPQDYSVEDAEHEQKLNQLKAKIDELTGGRIKHYYVSWNGEKLDGVISFAEMLAEDIKKVLLPEWKKKELLTPFERERLTHWSFIAEKNEMFSARSALVQKYYDDLTQNGKHFLAIKAPSGSGKSMLFSNLALKLRDSGYDVVPFMSGLTSESNDSIDILCNTIYYIEDLLGFSHESVDFNFNGIGGSSDTNGEEPKEKKNGIEKLRERLFELCVECEQANKRVIIMVDAVDQLASDDNRDNLIFIPERLSANVKFVMTCLPELDLSGQHTVTLKPMDDAEKREVIEGILRSHNRELEDKVIRKMIKLKASRNPLFLSLLVQRLLMMNRDDFLAIKKAGDDMEAISKHQLEVIATCPDSLQKMSAELLTEAGKRINEELVRKVAEYLAVSRHGLRQEDLAALLGDRWSALDFAHFITYMDENFIQRDDGRFDFSHKCIREGFLMMCDNTHKTHQMIVNHLYELSSIDSVTAAEITYHCIMANDKTILLQYMLDESLSFDNQLIVSKTLIHISKEDGGIWLNDLLLFSNNVNRYIDICRFIVGTFDYAITDTLEYNRIRYQVSKNIYDSIEKINNIEQECSFFQLTVEICIWFAKCNRSLMLSTYYSEGDHSLYVCSYEKAYKIAEKHNLILKNMLWIQYMAESAFQLRLHNPKTNIGRMGNFEVFGNYYMFYCNKALEHLEEVIRVNNDEEWLIKYAISQISVASLEEYYLEGRRKVDALSRGNNEHIKIAKNVAMQIGDKCNYKNIPLLCQLYNELYRFFADVNNTEYMQTAMLFLEKAICCIQKQSHDGLLLGKKKLLQSMLVQYSKAQVASNSFDFALKYGKNALDISKELFIKTGRLNYLYDIISLHNTYTNCITRKGEDYSSVLQLLNLIIETGNYLDKVAPINYCDRVLLKIILKKIENFLLWKDKSSKKKEKDLLASSKMIWCVFCLLLRSHKSIKTGYWFMPYFGGCSRVINECSKLDIDVKKNLIILSNYIMIYLKSIKFKYTFISKIKNVRVRDN